MKALALHAVGWCTCLLALSATAAASDAPPSGACTSARVEKNLALTQARLRLSARGAHGMAVMARDGSGAWRTELLAATHLEVERDEADALALRVAWCGDRAVTIDGKLFRFGMLPLVSEAPPDVLIERAGGGWTVDMPRCEAAGMHGPTYRFDVSGWSVRVGQQTFPIDRRAQEEFVFSAPETLNLDADLVPDVLLRYEERLGSGRQAFAATLLGCGDGGYVLVGSVPLGPVGAAASISRSSSADASLVVATKGRVARYKLDPRTRALTRVH